MEIQEIIPANRFPKGHFSGGNNKLRYSGLLNQGSNL
jgi:hypothetical protein